MVSTQPDPPSEPRADYVYVDWGPEFFAQHSLAFPNFSGAALTVNIGWLGLQRLLTSGGCGYFPLRLVRQHERVGRLHRVNGAPEFRLPAYVCFVSSESEAVKLAVETIHYIAQEAVA